jgi:phosphatidylglycerol:prolipoprotein diacylglycerol transferase
MLEYPSIDPVLLQLGPVDLPVIGIMTLRIHWYGLMYVLGFAASYMLVKYQLKRIDFPALTRHFENLNIVLIASLVIGGRLGYVLFYNLDYYLRHPLEIPATWSGGMAFHGAAIGTVIGGLIFARVKNIDFLSGADLYVVTIPIGLGLGRLGNFINGELFGRPTGLPWAMVFPGGGPVGRHPSQLYEALLEGLVLFCILWPLRYKPWRRPTVWPHGSLLCLFFICYGLFRFLVEFVREPDPQMGLLWGGMTMGQILSLVMIGLSGLFLAILRLNLNKSAHRG